MVTLSNVVSGCAAGHGVSAAPPQGPGVCVRGLPLSLTNQRAQICLSFSSFSFLLPVYRLNEPAASLQLLAQREGGGISMSPTQMLRL